MIIGSCLMVSHPVAAPLPSGFRLASPHFFALSKAKRPAAAQRSPGSLYDMPRYMAAGELVTDHLPGQVLKERNRWIVGPDGQRSTVDLLRLDGPGQLGKAIRTGLSRPGWISEV